MRKQRKKDKRIKLERQKRELREKVRISNVVNGLGADLSIMDIHRRTGLTQKNIRKIMFENMDEITFMLLKKQPGKKK